MTRYPGAEPAEVERLITEPISREIQSMSGVYKIKSESMYGISKITFELLPSLPASSIPQKWDELRRKVLNIQPQLPSGSSVPTVSDDFGREAYAARKARFYFVQGMVESRIVDRDGHRDTGTVCRYVEILLQFGVDDVSAVGVEFYAETLVFGAEQVKVSVGDSEFDA